MNKTKIEWTDYSWPIINGCRRKSAGCENCYAERLAATRLVQTDKYKGLAVMTASGPRWTGETRLWEPELTAPLKLKKPSRIFVADMGDLFYEGVSDEDIDKVFAVMALCPHHVFQVLTKRAERMQAYVSRDPEDRLDDICHEMPGSLDETWHYPAKWPLPNVHLGVSVEDQKTANERLPELLATPAVVRWASYEPGLGPIDFQEIKSVIDGEWRPLLRHNVLAGEHHCGGVFRETEKLNWIVVGGESGPGARPFDVQWARDTIAQCRAAGVPCFVKQLGSKPTTDHRTRPAGEASYWPTVLKSKKGGDWSEWPEDLRVREFPA